MCTWCYVIWRIRWVICQFRHPLALEDPHIIWLQAKDRVGQRIWKKHIREVYGTYGMYMYVSSLRFLSNIGMYHCIIYKISTTSCHWNCLHFRSFSHFVFFWDPKIYQISKCWDSVLAKVNDILICIGFGAIDSIQNYPGTVLVVRMFSSFYTPLDTNVLIVLSSWEA